jgi:predicted dinucleotide-binding enzyme
MKITIIGAGNMGRGIGTRAVAGGHEVEVLDRDPAEARALADQLGGSASVLEPSAAFGGEIVVFAVYYPEIKEAVEQYADRRLSAHLDPAAARPRLREHHQAPSVTLCEEDAMEQR